MKILSALIFLLVLTAETRAQELKFEYDNAGNQQVREWICVNCPHINAVAGGQQAAALKSDGPQKLHDDGPGSHQLSVYPNPLTETLNVKWNNDDHVFVSAIDIFSLNGVRLFHQKYASEQKETSISFLNFAPGSYLLKASYSNQKQEVVKLIKQ